MTRAYPLTPATFAHLLGEMDDEDVAALLADLRREEGWEVSVDGATVTTTRRDPREETVRLRVASDERSPIDRLLGRESTVPDLDDVDVLVVDSLDAEGFRESADEAGVALLDAGELYDQLLYAVDRRTTRALCRRHLERAVTIPPPAKRSAGRYRLRLDRLLEGARANPRRATGLAAVLAVVLVVGTIGVLGSGGAPMIEPGGGETPAGSLEDVTPVGMGVPTVSADTPNPSPTATPRNDDVGWDRYAGNLSESYSFASPREAILEVGLVIRRIDDAERAARAIGRMHAPHARPSPIALRDAVTDGNFSVFRTFDWLDWSEVEGLPQLPDNETPEEVPPLGENEAIERGYVTVVDGDRRVVFEFLATCRFGNETTPDACWQLVSLEQVDEFVVGQSPTATNSSAGERGVVPEEWDTVDTEWGSLPTHTGDICVRDPRQAIRIFAGWLEVSDESDGGGATPTSADGLDETRVRLAWNTTSPATRPTFEGFLASTRNGPVSNFVEFDRMRIGHVDGIRLRPSTDTLHYDHLSLWEDRDRAVYSVRTHRRQDTNCWKVGGISLEASTS